MKLFHISQTVNEGWDTYSDAVVVARSVEEARAIHPNDREGGGISGWDERTWARPINVHVKYLGEADPSLERGVICASFHAG